MRTTVNIRDELLRKAKKAALEQHDTLGSVIEQALQESLSRKTTVRRKPTHLSTFRGRGVQAGVDLDSTVSLLDVMEER